MLRKDKVGTKLSSQKVHYHQSCLALPLFLFFFFFPDKLSDFVSVPLACALSSISTELMSTESTSAMRGNMGPRGRTSSLICGKDWLA